MSFTVAIDASELRQVRVVSIILIRMTFTTDTSASSLTLIGDVTVNSSGEMVSFKVINDQIGAGEEVNHRLFEGALRLTWKQMVMNDMVAVGVVRRTFRSWVRSNKDVTVNEIEKNIVKACLRAS